MGSFQAFDTHTHIPINNTMQTARITMKTNRAAGALAPKVAARPARFMRVRAEPEKEPVVAASEPVTPPPPPPAKKAVSFGEAMAFSGAAPETINGRLAMLGFVGRDHLPAGRRRRARRALRLHHLRRGL